MATFTITDLTFTYPAAQSPALSDLNLTVDYGEFVVICGSSGCGKSTLLRNLKTSIAPHGSRKGQVRFYGRPLEEVDRREQAARIGYVLQNPDNQLVTDKVWHELAFGLESLGADPGTIRLRVAEMASFFGIQEWFTKDVSQLSGGQKQILNLASVMVMQPDVLILDEPTSQLDPIAAGDFLETVKKINREIGVTVILTEHRLEDVLPMADRAVVLSGGRVLIDDTPANTGARLAQTGHEMFAAMPSPLAAYLQLYEKGIGRTFPCPLDVREGRAWLTELLAGKTLTETALPALEEPDASAAEAVVRLKDVWFRYDKGEKDVVKDLSLSVYRGEFFCIVGGNGTGKSTALSLISGLRRPYRGRVTVKGKEVGAYSGGELYSGLLGVLPQNPQALFVESTVERDLGEVLKGRPAAARLTAEERRRRVLAIAEQMEISPLLARHPYDLSGGEQQRAALAKILLLEPEILLLDEPTKGLDNNFKDKLAALLGRLRQEGKTILLVSHDVEFCAKYGSRCAMFFDGGIVTTGAPRRFFSGNSFYTTAANRMSRHIFENAVTADDVAALVEGNWRGGDGPGRPPAGGRPPQAGESRAGSGGGPAKSGVSPSPAASANLTAPAGCAPPAGETAFAPSRACGGGRVSAAPASPAPGGPAASPAAPAVPAALPSARKRLRAAVTAAMLLLAPATLLAAHFLLNDRKYYFESLLIVFYAMIPCFLLFERRRPQAREIVVLAVLIAMAVAGRAAFFMLPSFKPMTALVIISAVSLGPQAGFLVGAMGAFLSNFLLGQGPWTPWQMFSFGLIGVLAGLLAQKGLLTAGRRWTLLLFGACMAFFVYGAIVDLWTIFGFYPQPSLAVALTVYTLAVPFNAIHAAATVIFLFFLAGPMIEKLERIKQKYGLLR